jgi:hypothetical protein
LFTNKAGVLEAYNTCLDKVTLHGPTNFSTIIQLASDIALQYQNGENYLVLLIITDGEITGKIF